MSICARGQDHLTATSREIAARGVKSHAAVCDLADAASIATYVAAAADALGGIEIARALSISLRAGTYSFDTIEHRPNRETCAVLHRIYAIQ